MNPRKFKKKAFPSEQRGSVPCRKRDGNDCERHLLLYFSTKNFFFHHFSFLSSEIIHSARFFRHNNGKSFQIDMSTSCHEIKHASTGHGTPPPRHAGFPSFAFTLLTGRTLGNSEAGKQHQFPLLARPHSRSRPLVKISNNTSCAFTRSSLDDSS